MDSNYLKNLFKILGIKDKNPSWKEIKSQYRKKIFKFHPDIKVNPKDGKEFIKVYEAYQLIKEKTYIINITI